MRIKQHSRLLVVEVAATLILIGLTPASASSANISHSYKARTKITAGNIVSLDAKAADYVVPSSTDNGSRLLGVAVATNDSLLAVDETDATTQVATSGNAKTYVSTLAGDIKVGDQIAVSPFNGIGMKASDGAEVIGLAQTAFSAKTTGAMSQEVTDKTGKKTTIAIGYVSVSIAIGINNTGSGHEKLSTLQKLGRSISGHPVSNIRIIISLGVALVALVSLVTLVYASIYGGIISVGRNPLAKYAVYRTVGAVLGMVAIVSLVAGTTIFFLLR